MQHGTATAPQRGQGADYLEHDRFTALAGSATLIVCHGGPATIAECRRLGHLPIVVPRRPDLGEHVDDHQVRFCDRLAVKGLIQVARDEEEFGRLLDSGIADPMAFELRIDDEPPVARSVRRFGELVAALPRRTARR